jgi:glycosyltransferase involved in cell wall biosynthesis
MRIAAFGFRSVPPSAGSAGADKFALEFFTRLAERGHVVTAYNRLYKPVLVKDRCASYKGIKLVYFNVFKAKGLDTFFHGLMCCFHIILYNTGDIVHIQNGGNSIWAIPLRLLGKKVFISQDGVDWRRDKWPWYGKFFLYVSSFLTAVVPNRVIFDNIFAKKLFEGRFKRKYDFIPFGCEVNDTNLTLEILDKFGLEPDEYFLFVGRFIPDKGLHYLIPAFERTVTSKKLVLIGGSPNPSPFESELRNTTDKRILFPGFVYGDDVHSLMRHAYAYVQPSDIEGLSPVILENMALGVPIICSDIQENIYVVGDCALLFKKSNIEDCAEILSLSIKNTKALKEMGIRGAARVKDKFTWDSVVEQHLKLFESK